MILLIKCDFSIIDDFKYSVFFEDKQIYKAFVDFYTPIVNLVKGEGLCSSKITIVDNDNKIIVDIFKHVKNILSENNFTIKTPDSTVSVREGKNFRIPDLYLRTKFGKINLWGEVKDNFYQFILHDREIASIQGDYDKAQKIYTLNIADEYKEETLVFLACVLIIDSMYHDY